MNDWYQILLEVFLTLMWFIIELMHETLLTIHRRRNAIKGSEPFRSSKHQQINSYSIENISLSIEKLISSAFILNFLARTVLTRMLIEEKNEKSSFKWFPKKFSMRIVLRNLQLIWSAIRKSQHWQIFWLNQTKCELALFVIWCTFYHTTSTVFNVLPFYG